LLASQAAQDKNKAISVYTEKERAKQAIPAVEEIQEEQAATAAQANVCSEAVIIRSIRSQLFSEPPRRSITMKLCPISVVLTRLFSHPSQSFGFSLKASLPVNERERSPLSADLLPSPPSAAWSLTTYLCVLFAAA
jgi:hypothetical protein